MNRKIVTAILAMLLPLATCMAQSPAMLLEKGIYNEETKGDINKAVEIYQQIISNADANRKYVAEAQYRLGVCLMKQKKPAQAIKCFEKLIQDFPNQKKFVAKAKEHIDTSRPKITGPELAKIVKTAVETISTCTEFDPRIKTALASLDGLNQQATVKEISKFLTSDTPNIRRSAIYILWKGNFRNISSAVPTLLKLCDNQEDKTRAMATLPLGQYKIESAFQIIAKMAVYDKSSYARQCAAYALGLMGNPAAKDTLEKAAKDKSELVSTNAKVAILMLNSDKKAENSHTKSEKIKPLPMAVMMWIVDTHMQAYKEAQAQGLQVNTHIYGVDDEFNKYNGGFLTYNNRSDKSISEEIPLGNFGQQRPDFELTNEQGIPQKYRLEKRTGNVNGRYRLWWKPDKPVPAGQIRLLGYLNRKTTKLPVTDGIAKLNMNNHFGSPVIENFFLVLPTNLEITRASRPYKTKVQRAGFDIYLWQRKLPANVTNTVTISLRKISQPQNILPLNKVVERTIYDDGVGKDFWIDLDTGKLYSPDPQIFKMNKQKIYAVVKELGLDAMAETASRRSCLYCVDMSVLPVSNDQWNNKNLVKLITDMSGWKTGSPVIMSALGELPKTYLFKTRCGNVGILQILEKVDKQPRHIKIRYKLLKYATPVESKSKMELSHDNGKSIGKLSIAGSGHGVGFEVPAGDYKLTAVKIYGSRYGYPRPPKENFYIYLCNKDNKVIKKFSFPYSKFKRGNPKWVTLPIKPTVVPKNFTIFVDFKPERTKGVYVHYSKADGNNSLIGLPGGRIQKYTKGNWMIRCEVKRNSTGRNQASTNKAPQNTNPVVLKTSPKALSDDVSPSLNKITVTFDQQMMNGSWSWTGGGKTFPKVTGKIHYDASRETCTLPVKLQPGKVYWIGINSPSHKNFKTPDRKPARRYVILFATRGEDGKPTTIPQKMFERAKAINGVSADIPEQDNSGEHAEARKLLDDKTRRDVEKIDRNFAPWFRPEGRFEAADEQEKQRMIERWMQEAESDNFKIRTRAITALGNVKAQQAVDILIRIADEPMRNNRPKWLAVRGLGEIGNKKAVPVLIELVDHGNWNTNVYARAALAQITGVYFGQDKDKWRQWWKENGKDGR